MRNKWDTVSLQVLPREGYLAERFVMLMSCQVGCAVLAITVKANIFLSPSLKSQTPALVGWSERTS